MDKMKTVLAMLEELLAKGKKEKYEEEAKALLWVKKRQRKTMYQKKEEASETATSSPSEKEFLTSASYRKAIARVKRKLSHGWTKGALEENKNVHFPIQKPTKRTDWWNKVKFLKSPRKQDVIEVNEKGPKKGKQKRHLNISIQNISTV